MTAAKLPLISYRRYSLDFGGLDVLHRIALTGDRRAATHPRRRRAGHGRRRDLRHPGRQEPVGGRLPGPDVGVVPGRPSCSTDKFDQGDMQTALHRHRRPTASGSPQRDRGRPTDIVDQTASSRRTSPTSPRRGPCPRRPPPELDQQGRQDRADRRRHHRRRERRAEVRQGRCPTTSPTTATASPCAPAAPRWSTRRSTSRPNATCC